MRTAIDASVLWCILKREPTWQRWQNTLQEAESDLVICEVAFAEISPYFASASDMLQHLEAVGIAFDPIQPEAAFLAGQIFKAYRAEGGPRVHMIADFLIGAHAQEQADELAALDRGYFRRYFPPLRLVVPLG
ncbi:MAG: type II toxin-antitoxin system VapC family toxin [Verrucomicrobia bacterium]|nr:type II toxin-antitoxin system VapC family toxin [Verrucomicrobiota bacterium]